MSDLGDHIEYEKQYELNIGKSFQSGAKSSYHHFKYDFTPASIDKNQEGKVTIGSKNDVTILVPHVEGSAQKHTQFTGNKQPASTKECVLIFDTRTGEFTLERLQSNFILKRSRLEGSSKAAIITPRSVTPTSEVKKKKVESSQSSQNDKKLNPMQVKAKETTSTPQSIKAGKDNSPVASNVSQLKADQLFGDDFNMSDPSDSDSLDF
ncbi:unnamed protein product [Brachionus calyciflorus]|uniref:Transcription elongation factor Eaf N-terminal domain-containing protein n=1 Tax=Brachionus calyciflorus TaxID=104777 RepID=A0A813ZU98_9BILA|nr:unnamed protein product [Brachionus calyciflorus]